MKLDEIKNLIKENNFKEAIDELEAFAKTANMDNELSTISGDFEDMEGSDITGTLSFNEKTIRRNKISMSILKLISKIEKKLEKEKQDIKLADAKRKKVVLFIYSNPTNKNQLDFGAEIRRIKDALITSPSADRDKYEIVVEEAVEEAKVFRLIRNRKPDFLHISLHASRKKRTSFSG